MTLTARISLSGEKELLDVFNALPNTSQTRILVPAMRKALEPARDEIERLTPTQDDIEDPSERGGQSPNRRMKRWIRIRNGKRSRKVTVVKVVFPNRKLLRIPGSAKWYYPIHVEYGTKDGRLAARRMASTGFKKTQTTVQSILAKQIERLTFKEVRRLARKANPRKGKP